MFSIEKKNVNAYGLVASKSAANLHVARWHHGRGTKGSVGRNRDIQQERVWLKR